MKRKTSRYEVSATLYDSEDRAVTVRGTYHAATRDYFCKSFGNWLPGDPEDIEILGGEAEDPGANVEEVLADEERCVEAIRETACDMDDGPDPDDERERRAEMRAEREPYDDRSDW